MTKSELHKENEHSTNLSAWAELKDYLNRNRYGLMGTLAFHMVLLILLLLFKLNSPMRFVETEIILAIPDDIVEQIEEENKRVEEEIVEKQKEKVSNSVDELLKSIAVNQDLKTENRKERTTQDLDKMIDDIKQELDGYESNDYGLSKKELEAFKRDSANLAKERKMQLKTDSLKNMEYSGPSSVFYSLKDRHKLILPIPVFKCEESGRVRVEITVNRQGKVIKAKVLEKESDTRDENLYEAAMDAAYRSRFNADNKSPIKQIGSITFNFVKQ
ncbi:TonB family protein [Ancylomarina sp. YFZ004]